MKEYNNEPSRGKCVYIHAYSALTSDLVGRNFYFAKNIII